MGTLAKSRTRTVAKPAAAAARQKTAPVEPPQPAPAPAAPLERPASGFGPIVSRTARAAQGAETTEHETQVVTFSLGKEEYAIDILQVQEIVMMTEITRMPKAPGFIEGIVNLRGQMIPIIDMRKRLDLAEAKNDQDTRIIILNVSTETVGMIVDGVREVLRIPDTAIAPPPQMIKGISAEYLKGIGRLGERLLIMLDLERVFSAEETEILRKLGPDGCPLTKE